MPIEKGTKKKKKKTMAILSSFNLLFLRISFLLTLAFYCLKDVNVILNNSYFDVLTQAMDLPAIQMSRFSGQLGLFSVLFVLLAINDLIPLLEDNRQYFFSMVPVRLTAFHFDYSFILGSRLLLFT